MTVCTHTIAADNSAYPRRLRELVPLPKSLDVCGILPEVSRVVAIVGARAASQAVVGQVLSLAAELARHGVLVVSGGALGIDGAAHRGALTGGGATVVVTGCGIDITYPERHRDLFADVVAGGGGLVSMFPRGTRPIAGCFVRRNAVIAGLADLVLVAEASSRSGSLHTVAAAQRLGRTVAAMPGSAGCDKLLSSGAALVRSADEVLAALDGQARHLELAELSDDEAALLAHVGGGVALEELASRAEQPLRVVTRLVATLEAAGWVGVDANSMVRMTGLASKRRPELHHEEHSHGC